MAMTRRGFLAAGAGAVAAAGRAAARSSTPSAVSSGPVLVSTWGFGVPVNRRGSEVLEGGGSLLDAVEQGICVAESDRGDSSVGLGGTPNADGVVQLDACIMSGPDHRAGSVAAIEGIAHPITAARRVMDSSPHVMLVGAGARQFALDQGLEQAELLTPEKRSQWERWRRHHKQSRPRIHEEMHDTIGMVGVDGEGNLAGGCSTSGWGYKMPGRVGDSPIIGSGLYVDNEVGAAAATGQGEIIMQDCGAFLVVEFMRQGYAPAEACAKAATRLAGRGAAHGDWSVSVDFVAVDRRGRFGAGGTERGFRFAVTTGGETRLEEPPVVRP